LVKIIPKITNLGDLGAVSPHFKNDHRELWREGRDPHANLVKIAQGDLS